MLSRKGRAALCWLAALFCAAAGLLGASALYALYLSSLPAGADGTLGYYLFNALQEALAFALPALLILFARPERWAEFAALRKPLAPETISFSALCAVGCTVAASALSALWTVFLQQAFGYVAPPNDLLIPQGAVQWALALFAVALMPAVCEELLFRALIQRGLCRLLPRAGVWLAAALFAGAHMQLGALPALFMIGATLGLIMRRRGLYAAMLFHGLYNACVLVLSARGVRLNLLVILLCAAAFVFSARYLIKEEDAHAPDNHR